MNAELTISRAEPRTEARITFPDDAVFSVPLGTPLEAVFKTWHSGNGHADAAIAAIVDSRLRELTIPVQKDMAVAPVTLRSSDGMRVYRRSLVFLLTTAAEELYPGLKVEVDHALPSGAFYCSLVGRENFSQQELDALAEHMRRIVAEDAPITRTRLPLAEAIKLFMERGDDDRLQLLDHRDKDYLMMYFLRGNADYFYGYMAPSTGYLTVFDLCLSDEAPGGFLLRYPRNETPDRLLPYEPSRKIAQVFERYADWLGKLGIEHVGQLNQALKEGRARELVLVSEALHEQHIAQIAGEITARHKDGARLVLIAGPSSSGKTTFSKRLAIQLLAHGLKPYTLELDRYFVDRDLTPRDEHGEFDFEALEALNRDLLNDHLIRLVAGREAVIPHFDFISGKSAPDRAVQLSPDHVLLVEGIHGLNPALLPDVPAGAIFRVYISALTQLNIDRHNRIPTTDVRLLRRIVRDATYRGYTAADTLARWPSVRRGEKRNIFPYQENADVMFNSALVYEVAALCPQAEPLLLQVEQDSPLHIEAKRLLSFLSWVTPLKDYEYIPPNSLLREFIGGSVLRDYLPGEAGSQPTKNGD